MPKRISGKILLLKSHVVSHVTERVGKLCKRERCTKVTEKSSTTSATIAEVALITFLLVLSQGMRIEFGNPNEPKGK